MFCKPCLRITQSGHGAKMGSERHTRLTEITMLMRTRRLCPLTRHGSAMWYIAL